MLKAKYLWALAVAALCVGAVSGTAVAQDSWANTASDLPGALVWDETYDASVDALNDGTTNWDANYELWSCEGTTSGGITLIDRWGLDLVPLASVSVPIGNTETFDFTVTAPPITGTFECDWIMSDGGSTFGPPLVLAEADVDINRFPDVGMGYWSVGEVEACAGMVPFIVQGFPDGFYRPTVVVRRDAMAVFVNRAMNNAETTPATATFPDVPTDFWAYTDIETLADLGVVLGYPNGYYRPEYTVSRDQMAVYVARAKSYALTMPGSAPFPDVPLDHWAVMEIDACVLNGVVQGYTDGLYRPTRDIDRGQLAVYVYRAFVQQTLGVGSAVVIGGPGLTDVNVPGAIGAGWGGFSSTSVDPDYAYVVFDGTELGNNLAVGGTFDIDFEFRPSGYPTSAATTSSVNISPVVPAPALATAWVAVPGLAADTYTLVVLVEDKNGAMVPLNRTLVFTQN